MQFKVLGSLEVTDDRAEPVALTSPSQRRLLALMLTNVESVVSADYLGDALGISTGGLHTAVSRLRKTLGVGAVATEPPGYVLRGGVVDAGSFEEHLVRARGAEPARRLEILREALGLWRGDAFAEFAHEEWARPEAARLTELKAAASEDFVEAMIASGHFAEAAATIGTHIEEYPLRDRPRGLLMRALAAQGRQSEAMRAYQDYRGHLGENIGTEPSDELQQLERDIAAGWHDTLEMRPQPAAAAISPQSRGVGVPTRTVTFLFTDVEGSTRLWQADDEVMAAALVHHDSVVRRECVARDAYVFGAAGDSFAIACGTAAAAVGLAVSVQESLRSVPLERRLRVRMGLHTGTAYERDGGYFGPDVNLAAQVMSAAHPDQILLSHAAAAQIDTDTLLELGAYRLRDIERPVRLFQLGFATHPPPNALGGAVVRLPGQRGRVVAGDRVQEVAAAVTDDRLVTLVGLGGIGKTTLAVAAAASLAPQFDDGVWFVDLIGASDDPDTVVARVAATVGIKPHAHHDMVEAVTSWFVNRSALIVLDNCERCTRAVARVASTMIQVAGRVALVTTSRVPLHLGVGQEIAPAPLAPGDARRMLLDRAGGSVSTDDEGIDELIEMLDGMPLAIELAASRCRVLSPSELTTRLRTDWDRVLQDHSGRVPERHGSLGAVIAWSVSQLSTPARQALVRATLFAGQFDVEAAVAVLGGPGLEEIDVLDILEELIEMNLMIRSPFSKRFRVLEAIRQVISPDLPETDPARQRYVDHFATSAFEIGRQLLTSDEGLAARRADTEIGDIRAAFGWTLQANDVGRAAEIVDDLFELSAPGRIPEVSAWASEALRHAERSAAPEARRWATQCRLTAAAGWAFAGRCDEAHAAVQEVLDSEVGKRLRARALFVESTALLNEGDFERLGQAAEDLLKIAEASGDVNLAAYARSVSFDFAAVAIADAGANLTFRAWARIMGTVGFVFDGRHGERVPHLLEAVDLSRRAANQFPLAFALLGLGHAYSLSDEFKTTAALGPFREGLLLTERQRNPMALWSALESVANGLGCLGDTESCVALWSAIDSAGQQPPDVMFRPYVTERLRPIPGQDRAEAHARGLHLPLADTFTLALGALDELSAGLED